MGVSDLKEKEEEDEKKEKDKKTGRREEKREILSPSVGSLLTVVFTQPYPGE